MAAASLLPAACAPAAMAGALGGPDFVRGHRLRDGRYPVPTGAEERAAVVIGGGGVAGLAAAWRLADAGFEDFVLYELEDETGGNARSGRNAVTAYPLGAHYLPVPNREARGLRRMLEQFGIIVGTDSDGAPLYDPTQICADLEERLLWRGRWQEGLYPHAGLTAEDERQRDAFFARMAAFGAAHGDDGRPAFAIPMAWSSRDAAFTGLDALSFSAWLAKEGFTSAPLLAHLRYCCRDDYGAEPDQVSAWAGIHYFAGRRGWAGDDQGDRELTWPEGNGRLVALMRARVADHVRTASPVFHIEQAGEEVVIDRFDHRADRARRTRARTAILAMPHFVASRVAPSVAKAEGFSYAPWVVANVTVSRLPDGPGAARAWDNVSAGSESLGYVIATHQTSSARSGPSVLTWYLPLSRETPKEARRLLAQRPLADWQAMVADDLLTMNPDLKGAIQRIDVWRWGHAMIRPTPGFLSDPARAETGPSPILLAHSDLSGLSIFEEAHYRGMVAAEAAMRALGHPFESLIRP